jgi:hypothetical protein
MSSIVPTNRATPAQIAAFRAGQHRVPAKHKHVPYVSFVKLEREDGYELQLPIKTEASNANGNRHIAYKKRSAQFDAVLAACQTQLRAMDRERVCTIDLTRIGPRPLDAHDNLPQSFKHVVDAVCSWLVRGDDFDEKDRRRIGSFDDQLIGQGKVSCRYAQLTHEIDRSLYGVRIRFRLKPKSDSSTIKP